MSGQVLLFEPDRPDSAQRSHPTQANLYGFGCAACREKCRRSSCGEQNLQHTHLALPGFIFVSRHLFHWAELVIAVLMFLQRDRCCPECVAAAGVANCFLKVEILDWEVIVAVFVWSADRCIVCLSHFGTHFVLFAQIAFDGCNGTADQTGSVI